MVNYREDVLQRYASRLYRMANGLVMLWAVLGGAVCGLGSLVMRSSDAVERIGDALGRNDAVHFIVAAFGGVLGLLVGLERSFMLRVQAQTVLCLGAIEMNTRATLATLTRPTAAGPAPGGVGNPAIT